MLMRLWPMGGRGGLNDNDNVVVQVPFSSFVNRVKNDDVQSVAIDGLHITFALKPGSLLLKNPSEGTDTAKVSFSTIRPADYSVPYDVLEKHQVQFSAVDKRNNRLMTVMVSGKGELKL